MTKKTGERLPDTAEGKDSGQVVPEPSDARLSKSAVLGCRMPLDEIKAVERAAAETGETVSEYVRNALLLRREGSIPLPSIISISIGNQYMQVDNTTSTTRASLVAEQANFVFS